jgi:hypothetical protein
MRLFLCGFPQGLAVLEPEDRLKVDDTIHLAGRRTDFVQQVSSMEIEHQKMLAVSAGADVALKVDEVVHEGDEIYRVT